MNHDQVGELLGAYALDAVDAEDAMAIADHLVGCPRCQAEMVELHAVAGQLYDGGGDLPDGVWERIERALSEPPPPLRLRLEAAGHPWKRRLGATGVAAAVVALVLLGVGMWRLRSDVHNIDRNATTSEFAARATRTMTAPGSRVARLQGSSESPAVAVVGADGQGYFLGQGLPALHDHIYQLWGATASGVVTSLGTVPGPGVYAFSADSSIRVVMVTVEIAPAPAPTTAAVSTGALV